MTTSAVADAQALNHQAQRLCNPFSELKLFETASLDFGPGRLSLLPKLLLKTMVKRATSGEILHQTAPFYSKFGLPVDML